MNNIARRIIAGVSAAALFVSAVGSDAFMGIFGREIYAVSATGTGKNGRSTGFPNLEQDTDGDDYNTGYGLHTNKTATAVGTDGRTFDVNLESWYVGENPVDVATILDASGSMAWTVDTLEPLEINTDSKNYESVNDKYGTIESIKDLQKIQDENGGYLPQDVVDCILDPKNTDNSKLSYSDYLYYVYEARSSVSEFVPLGYWDGGAPSGALKPIGYYPFDGTLENKASGGSTGKLINRVYAGAPFTDDEVPDKVVEAQFNNGGLDLSATDKNGNVIINLSDKLDINSDITISFELKCSEINGKFVPQSPILYLGDGTTSNYLALERGRSNNGNGGARGFYLLENGSQVITTGDILSNTFAYGSWLNCELKITKDVAEQKIELTISQSSTKQYEYKLNCALDSKKLYLVLGGNEILPHGDLVVKDYPDIDPTNLQGNYIKNLNITGTGSDASDFSAKFSLENEAGLTCTDSEGKELLTAKYCKQSTGSAFDVTNRAVSSPVVYTSDDKALNLTQTAKAGAAVLLDAKPTDSTYTIMFKVKSNRKLENSTDRGTKSAANLFYIGSNDTSENYYHIGIPYDSDPRHLQFYEYDSKSKDTKKYSDLAITNGVFGDKDFKYVAYVINETTIKSYFNIGNSNYKNYTDTLTNSLSDIDINVILAGLKDTYDSDFEIYIDDLYIFDEALNEEQVKLVAQGKMMKDPTPEKCGSYHATTKGNKDIAQISKDLKANPEDEERVGWYYVNSHSTWADIEGCLESGKQYAGIADEDDGEKYYSHDDVVTVPSSYTLAQREAITAGDNEHDPYVAPDTERSIRFYVDDQNHLRCFVHAGGTSKDGDPRTFCSLVYEKTPYTETLATDGTIERKGNATKYEELNYALNQFYTALAEHSDLTNSAVVRFSTINAIDKDKTDENLKKLLMRDWTNWSDYYQEDKKVHESEEGYTPSTDNYLQNLLIPDDGETSLGVGENAKTTGEYPYVMTGGTYTWTGLKAFYDNMVDTTDKASGDSVYNIANDARDKYLIIFTDGRDNTVGTDDKKYVHKPITDSADKDYETYKNSIGNFAPTDKDGNQKKLTNDSQLAKAWADKLKEEGYTIFCVMMATGSISPTANESEYEKAYNFLKTLAGDRKGEANTDLSTETNVNILNDYIIVADPTKSGNTTVQAFQDILEQIQQPRDDYTVQDYIDPRFDLIGADGTYKLGANGEITKPNGEKVTVGNVIEEINKDPDITEEECKKFGIPYTPIESYMVNREEKTDKSGYTDGDGKGTGYLYYDDVKDMYYLRWTEQIIPMENKAFTTGEDPDPDKKLDVWSATIRLKAKDDFIGGNDILTNGNEAGENLVYSDATIENMDKNYKLYDLEEESTYREKLEVLSGTNRKINAVDADGVSQAVYGNGIDIPSSGFPRVTVNVRLLELDAKNLNDVIYMGEVVSPTMMLADLEKDYMTGSYYLEYLKRYAYRLYGYDATKTPLLELLNQWLKINEKDKTEKTFTIPYMYLPAPIYVDEGKLVTDGSKVKVENNTGMSTVTVGGYEIANFNDLNLRDVTGFITYTWKRDDGNEEKQQEITVGGETKYDITKEYVVKNTDQIQYNLQLKFTPLKDHKLDGFDFDDNVITDDKFFDVDANEFKLEGTAWDITDTRSDYLKAMVKEEKTYEPHVMYDETSKKWVLVDNKNPSFDAAAAVKTYIADPTGQTTSTDSITVTDSGVYDWDSSYKKAQGNEQLEEGLSYTKTLSNVTTDEFSLIANTTYTKDVVNAALALKLVVDGKYLQGTSSEIRIGKEYTFIATRYYDDPSDPLLYGGKDSMYADTDGKKYRLTFKVDEGTIPSSPVAGTFYHIWAKLIKVEVKTDPDIYVEINDETSSDPYCGYEDAYALPIGTYVISIDDDELNTDQFKISDNGTPTNDGDDVYFAYLKIDQDEDSYTYNRFPESVYGVSENAMNDTGDGEYLIYNEDTKEDNSKENIADSSREKDKGTNEQILTFNFGTVDSDGTKGKGIKERPESDAEFNDYAKDRLGIIMLSKNKNSLFISKKVTHVNDSGVYERPWQFTITVTPSADAEDGFGGDPTVTLNLNWYKLEDGNWIENTDRSPETIVFTKAGEVYTATISIKHNERVKILDLPEGEWQVTEIDERTTTLLYSAHNNKDDVDEYSWSNETKTLPLQPGSFVDFENEFPYNLPSAGGIGTNILIYCGITFMLLSGLSFAILCRRGRSRDKPKG